MLVKKAIFCFESSIRIGAGHAIRSCVLADALVARGWLCKIVTTKASYQFISNLSRFERIDPDQFYAHPEGCDLLVIDNYELDERYESHFRSFASKIMVIDDLADRKHDCDLLLDQTYGRKTSDYVELLPGHCQILAGSDFILLGREFITLRPKALEKRRNAKKVNKILISMGGSDPNHYILKALELIKVSTYKGFLDVVLGFSAQNQLEIEKCLDGMPNEYETHIAANMATRIFEADLAIGSAGSSVWERWCLGLPSVVMVTAENQKTNYDVISRLSKTLSLQEILNEQNTLDLLEHGAKIVDGFGINRVLSEIENCSESTISFRKVLYTDLDLIFKWQNIKGLRQYFNNPEPPLYDEHTDWFIKRLNQYENPYWVIKENQIEIGAISLTYNNEYNMYDLSWYILPDKCGKGLGTSALKLALAIINPFKIRAQVNDGNLASHKSLVKLGFRKVSEEYYIS